MQDLKQGTWLNKIKMPKAFAWGAQVGAMKTSRTKTSRLVAGFSLAVAGASLPAVSAYAISTATASVSAAAELSALLGHTSSMTAEFVQMNRTPKSTAVKSKDSMSMMAMSRPTRMTGKVWVEKPSHFRWETKAPAPQLIVTEGSTLWVYDPDLMQATQQTLDDQIAETPALLLSGKPDQIVKNYAVKRSSSVKHGFVLTPKSEQSPFESMGLIFSANKTLKTMILKDNLGQVTVIRFNNVVVNPVISAAQFRFTPPQGTDVIAQ